MKTRYCLILFLFLIPYFLGSAYGQVFDDVEGRFRVSIEHEFDNGIKVRGRYSHYLDQHISHYKRSGLGVKIDYDYKINSWLEPGIDYRYQYNGKQDSHDIRYSITACHGLKNNLKLEYSLKLQQKIASAIKPEFYIRNKIELGYEIIRPLSIFIFSENYQIIEKGLSFSTQKSGLEAEYKMNKNNELEFKFDIKNKSTHQDIARVTFNYTYIIE